MAIILDLHGRALERREESTSGQGGVTQPLPTSVKALTGFIVVMGLIILGIAAWRIGKWRRNKIRRAASQDFAAYAPKTKGTSLVHAAFAGDDDDSASTHTKETVYQEPYKWRPLSRPPVARASNKAVKKGTKRFIGGFMPKKPSPLSIESSPPPAYDAAAAAAAAAELSPPTIVIDSAEKPVANAQLTPATIEMLKTDPNPSSPLPSPRTTSIGPDTPLHQSLSAATAKFKSNRLSKTADKTPRLMVVVYSFTPSLEDELAISVGEPLKMIQEYEDEWCLVQRLGKPDLQRGVIPRFCIQDIPKLSQKNFALHFARQQTVIQT